MFLRFEQDDVGGCGSCLFPIVWDSQQCVYFLASVHLDCFQVFRLQTVLLGTSIGMLLGACGRVR